MANVIALHNTTARKLRFADTLGGMPCPSIAYISSEHCFESFGDITLLCSPEMANPAQSSLYVCDSDIYSSRFPSIEYSVNSNKLKNAIERSNEIAEVFSEKSTLTSRIMDSLENKSIGDLISYIRNFPELFIQFEEEHLGKRFDPNNWEKEEKKFCLSISDDRNIQQWVNKRLMDTGLPYLSERDPKINELTCLIENFIDQHARDVSYAVSKNAVSNFAKKRASKRDYDYFKAAFEKDYFTYDSEGNKKIAFRVLPQLERDHKVWSRSTDPLSTKQLIDYIQGQPSDTLTSFESWLYDKFEPVIDGAHFYHETASGNIRKKKLSLESLTSTMKKDLRGGENFNYGAGSVRAHVAKNFKKWRSIQENASRMVSEDEFEKTKKEYNDKLIELIDKLMPFYKFKDGNSFRRLDDVSDIISEYARGRTMALKEGFNLDDDFPKEAIDSFLKELREAPTQYFEGKFKKEIYLSEFSGAVIPDDIFNYAPDIIDILDRNNIPYGVYEAKKPESRLKAIKELSENHLLFKEIESVNRTISPN